jgi:hypothetical protein
VAVQAGKPCPKCGRVIDWVERRVVNGHVYVYAAHVSVVDGKKKITKCYLGPDRYTYATKTHSDMGMELKGMAYEIDSGPGSRFLDYINDLANKLTVQAQGGALDLERARGWLRAVREATARLQSLADMLEGYVRQLEAQEAGAAALAAPNDTVARPQPLKAPQVTSQAQTTEARPAEGEAYRMVSMLVGLTPEDVERQVRELQEALREVKRAQTTR